MERLACAFTGHRPKSFPWKYDETAYGCIQLKKTLAAQIGALVDSGVTDFFSGMALGIDYEKEGVMYSSRCKSIETGK